jgi:hypothetical protein
VQFGISAEDQSKRAGGHGFDLPDAPFSVAFHQKYAENLVKFPNREDRDFKRISELIIGVVQTRQLVDAAVGSLEEMEFLVTSKSIDVNLRDRWDQTALHVAIQRAREPHSMVRLLLRPYSADPSPKDRWLNTLLHYAVERNDISIVQELLNKHANIDAQNDESLTPADLAARHPSRRRISNLLREQPRDLVKGPVAGFKKISGHEIPKLPQSPEGQLACKSFQVTATEIFKFEESDRHWSLPVSVKEMIYGSSTLERILSKVRPKDVPREKPVCRWLHIYENNMTWVEDLFTKLGYGGSIWAGEVIPAQLHRVAPSLYMSRW